MPTLNDIRSGFLTYFGDRDHQVTPSAPLVPENDPTLLFVNAGMVPFKNIFTGAEAAPAPRATSSQKCVRAGGKHNDLDNVGYTARHHTFFEMLGNFSFGDYFKDRAIELAWTLITQEFAIPKEKLLVTVYSEDEEAAALWRKIAGLPDERIIRIATSDNFWSMGETGPCGPCSEIFYDHGEAIPGGPPGSADEDGDRFVEIWNLVFMQYEQFAGGRRETLPRPSIDTGMGLERVSAVLQGVSDNYDTDLFKTLIAASVEATGVPAEGEHRPSHRVIADHLRSSAFLVADGVSPSNEGRGYVLRRIMRRAMRHAHLLGAEEPLLWRLAPTLIDEMGAAYPELRRAASLITETLRQEEERFRRTLGRGMGLLEDATRGMRAGDRLDGETAFKLYDTYGFPLDLTQDALRPLDIHVDVDGFEEAMSRQKERARDAWVGSGDKVGGGEWAQVRDRLGPTEFLGYEQSELTAEALAILKGGVEVDVAAAGDTVQLVFDRTPFYAESGGQASDPSGLIEWPGGEAKLITVSKEVGGLLAHTAEILSGRLSVSQRVRLELDLERRAQTRANHSAAHLVHAALKNVLGDHVAQKGQLVDADRMRFDYSHGTPLTASELDRVEAEVNAVIRQNVPAETRQMSPSEAIAEGAVALFGEKYGDSVRVLSLGRALSGDGAYSIELCGGTHVARTGDLALFKIVSDTGIASGIRRIEALTGEAARRYLLDQAAIAKAVSEELKTPIAELPQRVEAMIADRKKLERELADAKRRLALGGGTAGPAAVEEVGGLRFIGRILDGVDGKALRPIIEELRKQADVVVIVGTADGKAAAAVASAVPDRFSSADLVKRAVVAMGGQGGGGRADFAQGGAPAAARAQEGIEAVKRALEG